MFRSATDSDIWVQNISIPALDAEIQVHNLNSRHLRKNMRTCSVTSRICSCWKGKCLTCVLYGLLPHLDTSQQRRPVGRPDTGVWRARHWLRPAQLSCLFLEYWIEPRPDPASGMGGRDVENIFEILTNVRNMLGYVVTNHKSRTGGVEHVDT